jgi:hypothetical protein
LYLDDMLPELRNEIVLFIPSRQQSNHDPLDLVLREPLLGPVTAKVSILAKLASVH